MVIVWFALTMPYRLCLISPLTFETINTGQSNQHYLNLNTFIIQKKSFFFNFILAYIVKGQKMAKVSCHTPNSVYTK